MNPSHDPPTFTVSPLSGGETVFLRCLAAAHATVALQQDGGVVATGRVVAVEDDGTVVLLPPGGRYNEHIHPYEFNEVTYL
jgi:quercetin dioxygenase-like cupin family protein